MNIIETSIDGLIVVSTVSKEDNRGSFTRLFCGHELNAIMKNHHIVQINHSKSSSIGTVRGMHFQYPPYAEIKLIRCLKGRVWDVGVDLRAGSKSFLKWYGEELSEKNSKMMVIPEGFAHGFQVLESHSELLYLHTSEYKPEFEGGLSPLDPTLGIKWPLPINEMSIRDSLQSIINQEFKGIVL